MDSLPCVSECEGEAAASRGSTAAWWLTDAAVAAASAPQTTAAAVPAPAPAPTPVTAPAVALTATPVPPAWLPPQPRAVPRPVFDAARLAGCGVTVEDLMRNTRQWPVEEAPRVTWTMPYYAQGVYEEDNRVIIGTLPTGETLSIPIPPLIARRRRRLVDLWTQRSDAASFDAPRRVVPSAGASVVAAPPPPFLVSGAQPWPQSGHGVPLSVASSTDAASLAGTPAGSVLVYSETPHSARPVAPVFCGVPVIPTMIGGIVQVLGPVGGLLPPCTAAGRCPSADNEGHRAVYAHPCRHGAQCMALRGNDEVARRHLAQCMHPSGTLAAVALLTWLASERVCAPAQAPACAPVPVPAPADAPGKWAETWAGRALHPCPPLLFGHQPAAPEGMPRPALPLCPFGTSCVYACESSHSALFAHVCLLPLAACARLRTDPCHAARCVHHVGSYAWATDDAAAGALAARHKTHVRAVLQPHPLPPCPYFASCALQDEPTHARRYSHPCPHGDGRLATCPVQGDAAHRVTHFHRELIEAPLCADV